jgi:hypothetical protein
MKNVSKLFFAFVILCAAVLTSCDKEVESTSVSKESLPKATIKGIVYANTDLTKYGYEFAPAGTQAIVTMSYSQIAGLNSNGKLNDTVLIKGDGSFEYQVPSDADGVDVEVSIKFVFNQEQQSEVDGDSKRLKTFTGSASYSDIKANETQVKRIDMTEDETLDNEYKFVTISGTVFGNYDLFVSGDEKISSQVIIFHTGSTSTDSWSKTITTGSDGKYTVDVPYDKSIYIDYGFSIQGKNGSNETVTYKFNDLDDYIGAYSVDTENEDLTIYKD